MVVVVEEELVVVVVAAAVVSVNRVWFECAVRDATEGLRLLRDPLGVTLRKREEEPSQGAKMEPTVAHTH